MTEQTKTPWFDAAVHDPVHPGVYLVKRFDEELWWRAFDGKDWYTGFDTEHYRGHHASPNYDYLMERSNLYFFKLHNRSFKWCGITRDLKKSDK